MLECERNNWLVANAAWRGVNQWQGVCGVWTSFDIPFASRRSLPLSIKAKLRAIRTSVCPHKIDKDKKLSNDVCKNEIHITASQTKRNTFNAVLAKKRSNITTNSDTTTHFFQPHGLWKYLCVFFNRFLTFHRKSVKIVCIFYTNCSSHT